MNRNRLITGLILFGILTACVGLQVEAQPDFQYLTEFEANAPMAMAADANGGIYYTSFTFAGPNLSKVYYVADPLGSNALDNHRAIIDDDPSPAGRGWHGVAVDDVGAVYAVLESGSNDSSEVRKLTAAPDFELDEDFGVFKDGQRHNSVAWMGRDAAGVGYIAVTTFGNCEIWDADYAGAYMSAGNGESFQRDCVYNPDNGEIYISTNHDRSGDDLPQRSVNVWRGGTAQAIEDYEEIIINGFIGEGAANSTWGINGQQIGFDQTSGLIMIAYRDAGNGELNCAGGFYDPANPETAVRRLDGHESPDGPFLSPTDMVTVETDGAVLLYVTDIDANRIVIFTTGQTSVDQFMLY